MSLRRRALSIAGALCGAGAIAVAMASGAAATGDRVVPLAPLVAQWPDSYVLNGAKSEPLYTEDIRVRRDGNEFSLRIRVTAQGDAAFGTQESAVQVAPDGTVAWTEGCPKPGALCADDTQLRGFLGAAALIGLARAGRLPETGVERELYGDEVVCIEDSALHPDAPAAIVRLDPCVDPATGAVVAHWSPDSAAFVGATLAPGFRLTR